MNDDNDESLQVGDLVMHWSFDKGYYDRTAGIVVEASKKLSGYPFYRVTWFDDDTTLWMWDAAALKKVK